MRPMGTADLVIASAVLVGMLQSSPARADRLPLSRGWEASVGTRIGLVRDAGFDAYAEHDDLTQLSLSLRRTVWFRGKLSLLCGAGWDWGGSTATVRGGSARLLSHRLGVTIEVRQRLHSALAVYGRLMPGAVYDREELKDASATLDGWSVVWAATSWSWSLDAAAGAALRVLQVESERGDELSFWLSIEGGYGYTPKHDAILTAELPAGDPRQTAAIDMGALSLRGGFLRLAFAIAY